MTHAAVLHTEQPDLQALFDEDWASGKYRRPKCSKADYYAGWLVAYERFRTVMATEKVAIVENPAKPARAPQPKVVKEKYEQSMMPCSIDHVDARGNSLGMSTHNKFVTRYVGGLPLKRNRPDAWRTTVPFIHGSGQAIPDSMIRKLAIMAGRPEIAP